MRNLVFAIWGSTLFLAWIFQNELGAAIEYFAPFAAIIISLIAVIGGLVGYEFWQHRRENRKLARAERRLKDASAARARLESQIYTVIHKVDEVVHIKDLSPFGLWRNASLDARRYANGPESAKAPTSLELAAWQQNLLAHSTSKKPDLISQDALQQPVSQELPTQVDLAQHLHNPSIRNLFLGIGRFPDGHVKPVYAPLATLVHIACGGSSGFGKSTFMVSLAYQILNAREDVTPVLLDAQGVSFTPFVGNKSLLYPLASEPGDILTILIALVAEMQNRQRLFGQWKGIASIGQYNQVAREHLSVIPIFFDEFGILADDKKIAKEVGKLAKAGRKFGLYLIAGSQTWGADEISTKLRANLSTSVQFFARDKHQSRILLNNSRAAEIERPGQAFCLLPGQPGLIELQAPHPGSLVDIKPELISVDSIPSMPVSLKKHTSRDSQDTRFIELVHAGNSRRQASLKAYKKDYAGAIVTRGKKALGEL